MKTKKLLIIFLAAVMLTFYGSTKVYASELGADTTTAQETVTEDSNNTGASDNTTVNDAVTEDAPAGNVVIDEQGQVYEDGKKVDEQGQILEEDPQTEDPAIEDNEDQDKDQSKEDTSDKSSDDKDKPASTKPAYSQKDLRYLACLVFSESGNQPYEGQLAVANVVLNRVKSNVFWHVNTIKEVIYDRKWSIQFSVTIKSSRTGISPLDRALKLYDTGTFTGSNLSTQEKLMSKSIKAAKAALEGENNIGNYLCFTNKRYSGNIKKHYPGYKIIGDHIFYRTK